MALDLDQARDSALRELRALVARCESLTGEDWARPTPCEGWLVSDLIGHLAPIPGYGYFAGRLRAVRLGVEGPNTNGLPILTGPMRSVVDALRRAADEFEAEVAHLTPDDLAKQLPILPGRTQILSAAVAQYVWEFGLHRYDLEYALGTGPELPPDVCRGVAAVARTNWRDDTPVDAHVPRWATPRPGEPVSYVLAGDAVRWEFSFTPGVPVRDTAPTRNGNWSAGAVHERCCTVRGTDSAICLVLCGRISTHDQLVSATPGFVARKFTVW